MDVCIKHSFEGFSNTEKKIELLIESGILEKKSHIARGVDGIGRKFEELTYKVRITPKGLNFLNNLRTNKINSKIFWLTFILILFGSLQTILMILQIIL